MRIGRNDARSAELDNGLTWPSRLGRRCSAPAMSSVLCMTMFGALRGNWPENFGSGAPGLDSVVGMPAQAWVTLIIGLIATAGVLITWRQKNTADRRSEWWRRTTWALELTFSGEQDQRRLGWSLLLVLATSKRGVQQKEWPRG